MPARSTPHTTDMSRLWDQGYDSKTSGAAGSRRLAAKARARWPTNLGGSHASLIRDELCAVGAPPLWQPDEFVVRCGQEGDLVQAVSLEMTSSSPRQMAAIREIGRRRWSMTAMNYACVASH